MVTNDQTSKCKVLHENGFIILLFFQQLFMTLLDYSIFSFVLSSELYSIVTVCVRSPPPPPLYAAGGGWRKVEPPSKLSKSWG